jgi:hypothetical protein
MTQSDIELDLGAETLACSAEEAAAVFAGLLREIQAATQHIRRDERLALRRIMATESGTLTVADVFPDFERESDEHMTLRRLRTAQFILPAGRDVWEPDQRIAIKPFARLAWDRLGEAALFGDAPEEEQLEEEQPEEPQPVEEIDLALPEVHETDAAETVRLKGKKAADQWNDDDVLDFLRNGKDAVG